MATSYKLSAKKNITVPKAVREALGVGPGDFIAYEIEDDRVRMKRVEPFDAEYSSALYNPFDEWSSPEDEEAFGDL